MTETEQLNVIQRRHFVHMSDAEFSAMLATPGVTTAGEDEAQEWERKKLVARGFTVSDRDGMTDTRRRELLAATPQGQATLEGEDFQRREVERLERARTAQH